MDAEDGTVNDEDAGDIGRSHAEDGPPSMKMNAMNARTSGNSERPGGGGLVRWLPRRPDSTLNGFPGRVVDSLISQGRLLEQA